MKQFLSFVGLDPDQAFVALIALVGIAFTFAIIAWISDFAIPWVEEYLIPTKAERESWEK